MLVSKVSRWLVHCCMLVLLTLVINCHAAPDPLELVKGVTDRMVEVLVKDRTNIAKDNGYLISKIDQIVLPHFDILAMSRSVVGRQYWEQASEQSRNDFVKVFTKYVENTYSGALKTYNGEEIKFYPMRNNSASRAQVVCDLFMNSGTVRVVYNLYVKSGDWLIYDFSINNVSLVKNYNAQFAGVLRQHGLAGLVEQLKR